MGDSSPSGQSAEPIAASGRSIRLTEMSANRSHEPGKKTLSTLAAGVAGLVLAGLVIGALLYWYPEDSQDADAVSEAELEQRQQEEQQKKLGYEITNLTVQPGVPGARPQLAKPGHWATVTQRIQMQWGDFVGQWRTAIVDARGATHAVSRTPFLLQSTRPVTLTKGRPKRIETTCFVPQIAGDDEAGLAIELRERGLGLDIRPPATPLVPMPSYQYYFVVLAKEPSRYALVKSLDSVTVPFGGENEADDPTNPLHYRVVQPDVSQFIPLSDNALTWTSIAYILWDEVDPRLFTTRQKEAMLDWLHWGGQLVINGPDSLDLLKGSFLEPYLPATSTGARTILPADLDELNRAWTVSSANKPGEPLTPSAPWSGVALVLHPDAKPLPSTGMLLVERSVGSGRIVVSAMQLTERELVNWRSGFESLFNACVLRRPPRVYRRGYFGDLTLAWADQELAERRLDARLTTGLRYFARDLGVPTSYRYEDVTEEMLRRYGYGATADQAAMREYRPPEGDTSIGAWNDFSAVSGAARTALKQEAGIDVPDASFVVLCLAVYLIALVPLNWLVFHALRRVEWAWLAAPVMAVVGTFIVVHQAQLDIGFVRSQTEIDVLELQPEYARGHLARYTALYTSLSAIYELEFDDLTTLAAPFPAKRGYELLAGQSPTELEFHRYDKVRLTGLPILSNSTSMVHSEQMIPLEGIVRLGRSKVGNRERIENRSQLHLRSVGLVRRPAASQRAGAEDGLLGMWIGDLPSGESAAVAFVPLDVADDQVPFAKERRPDAFNQHADRLDLEPLFRLAYDRTALEPGEVRLVGRVDEPLPGETVRPEASQTRATTLVVAHLHYAPLPPPRPDLNTRQDVKPDRDE